MERKQDTPAFSNLENSVEMELIGFRLCFRDGFKPILAFCNSGCLHFGIAEFLNHYNKPKSHGTLIHGTLWRDFGTQN